MSGVRGARCEPNCHRGARQGALTGHVPAGTHECRPHLAARCSGLLLGVPAVRPERLDCIHRLLSRDRRPQRTRQYPQRAHRSYIHF